MLRGHGDDGYRHGVAIRANFSSNVRSDVDLTALRDHLFHRFDRVASYPEVAAESLTAQLAVTTGLTPAHLLVTNGATTAIYLIAEIFRAHRSAIVEPTFAEYGDACVLHAHVVQHIDRLQFSAGVFANAELVWLCSPNNPTGEVFSRAELLALFARHPHTRFVVDLAYADFCAEPPLRADDVLTHPNLLVVQSLTKNFGVPGLRIGYIAAAPEQIRALTRHHAPWSVNTLALEAGHFFLSPRTATPVSPTAALAETRRFMSTLAAIPGLTVHPSATTFFLVELERGTAAELKSHLLQTHGLLVRDASNFRGLGPRHVRLATQTPEKNWWLAEALTRWTRS